MVTAKEPIAKVAPIETRTVPGHKERMPVVGVDMDEAARIGLIKIDALGLKTLSVISDTLKTINKRNPKPIKLEDIPMDDKEVYTMLSDGHTKGVFQCEAAPYTRLLTRMGVSNFNDLAASNALVRPGAMNTIGKEFIERKHGRSMITYLQPVMKEFTEKRMVRSFTVQVMLACDLGVCLAQRLGFVRLLVRRKTPRSLRSIRRSSLLVLLNLLAVPMLSSCGLTLGHAGYSFNKSHAVAYSTLSYWTAWLKLHYPLSSC